MTTVNHETLFAESNTAFVEEDFVKALDLLSQAISADPQNSRYYLHRSITNYKLNNFENAIEDAQKSIALGGGPKAYLRLAMALEKTKKYEAAMHAYEKGQDQAAQKRCEDELKKSKHK